jgi:hypothetical protein
MDTYPKKEEVKQILEESKNSWKRENREHGKTCNQHWDSLSS